jgi:flagellar biosynthesis/type III secretory pathway chaperone
MTMDKNTATLLVEALKKECNLYRQMLVLSNEQAKLMEGDDPDLDRIAVLMDEKVQLSSEIEALEDEHLSIKKVWEQSYESYPNDSRLAVKAERDQITEMLETLQQLEQRATDFLQSAEKEVSAKLKGIYQSRSINRAYFHAEKHPPKYINRFSK